MFYQHINVDIYANTSIGTFLNRFPRCTDQHMHAYSYNFHDLLVYSLLHSIVCTFEAL